MKKLFIILGLITGALAGFVAAILIINLVSNFSSEEAEDSEETIEATEVREHEINLSDYDTNIAITEEGEYQLYGDFSHIIKIDIPIDFEITEKPQVVLSLNDVNIISETAAIKNVRTNDLTLSMPPKTENNIISTGDVAIETAGYLAIEGQGALTVWNQQTEGRGVAVLANNMGIYGGEITLIGGTTETGAGASTKDRYWIKDGDVTILGTDMLEPPVDNDATLSDIKPRSASFSLKEIYPAGSAIKVLNGRGARVATYTAPADFRTIIVSNHLIVPGEYTLYIDNAKVKTVEVQ
ncbi:carbohydrate-binding domain-containing protein [Candidatus Saccharibacteria bacterium]|nr:carbohydrate-binding domain-containing protein [Candidatus Saccharibacteria bacterium]